MSDSATSTETAPDPDLSGKRFGDYLILRRLGRGGMAEVYLAQQQSLDRHVAFKVLRQSLAGDENYVRRFHHEARAAATLTQANIVQIYEVGELEGTHFIAQEYVQGQNVKQYLNRHGAIDVFLAVNIMRQVAAALHKASEHEVIHRDIKPENIMIAATGEVKVADFGLARINRAETSNELTQVGITMGTPLYMSPEQVEGNKVDPRSDIYSFGITCYEMLAGRPPFEGDNALTVAVKHLKEEPIALESVRPDIPSELGDIIRRMMAKRPQDRYQSPSELLRDLRAIQLEETDEKWAETLEQLSLIDGQLLATRKTSSTQRLGDLMQRQTQRKVTPLQTVMIGAVGFAMLGLIGGFVVASLNPPRDLLEVDQSELEKIPQRETAEEQYRLAYQLRSERAWKAVRLYFDPSDSSQNQYYIRLADARLGELYLNLERYEDAIRVYSSLEQVEEIDREFRLIGFAGTSIAYDRIGNENLARQSMVKFDDEFVLYRQGVRGGPRDWNEFFRDNDFIRAQFAELRERFEWTEAVPRRPESETGS